LAAVQGSGNRSPNADGSAETAIELARFFPPDGFAVETNQFQELLAAEVRRVARPERSDGHEG
jgi:hypothetical protein